MISFALLFAITGFACRFRILAPVSRPRVESHRLRSPTRRPLVHHRKHRMVDPSRARLSSPIVPTASFRTAAVTRAYPRSRKLGTKFTEEFAGELMKQGVPMKDVIARGQRARP
jgi:hypothetical protein